MAGATVGQLLGQLRPTSITQHVWGIVVSVAAPLAVVQLQPGGQTDCQIPTGITLAAGSRVLVLVAPIGNVVLALMPPLPAALNTETP